MFSIENICIKTYSDYIVFITLKHAYAKALKVLIKTNTNQSRLSIMFQKIKHNERNMFFYHFHAVLINILF